MAQKIKRISKKFIALVCMFTLVFSYTVVDNVDAAVLDNRSLTIGDSAFGATGVDYVFLADFSTTSVLCIQAVFCTTATGACTPATGIATGSADKGDTGDWTGFTYGTWTGADGTTAGSSAKLTSAGEAGSTADAVVFGNITNPSATGIYYARITTYTNADCSTGPTDEGALPFAILDDADGVTVTATVDESMTFTSDDYTMDLGSWTATTEERYATAETDGGDVSNSDPVTLGVSTNAADGLSVTVRSTGSGAAAGLYDSSTTTLITATASSTVAATVEAYALFVSGVTGVTVDPSYDGDGSAGVIDITADQIASSAGPVSGTIDVAVHASIASTTAAGSYEDILTFVVTPIY